MIFKSRNDKLALLFGVTTLILFSAKPFILDLIEPSKSIGQVLGENAKDFLESFNGKENIKEKNTNREIWSSLITLISFTLFILTFLCSSSLIHKEPDKGNRIGLYGEIFAIVGLVIYISHFAIWLVLIIIIALIFRAFILYG